MGLTENEREEMDRKDSQIAALEREVLLSKLKNGGENVAPATPGVNAVTVKLPDFYENDPEMWFVRAECQFRTKRIVDDTTKFDHIVQSLSEKVARRVRRLILYPPATDKVTALKAGLMTAYGRTQLEKDTALLSMRMINLKPSEVIARAEALNSDPATFFKAFILSQFAPEVKTAITNMEFTSLVEMGVAADKALEASKTTTQAVNAIVTEIQDEFDEEDAQAGIFAMGRGGANRGRGGRGAGRGFPSQGSQKPVGGKGKTCFYHDKHGLGAYKCDGAPCPFVTAPLAKAGNATAGR